MGRKKQKITTHKKTKTPTKAYELHTEAVEKLANADEGKEKYSKEELKQYKKNGLDAIPVWAKSLFIKFWFYAALCYFVLMGLGIYIKNVIDQLIVLALATGMFNDLIVNNIMRFLDEDGSYMKWVFFSKKSYFTLFGNILLSAVVVFIVSLIYAFINKLTAGGLGVEPFLYGVLCLLVETGFVGIKLLIIRIIKDANNKLEKKNNDEKKE